jgi:hypothetical protein
MFPELNNRARLEQSYAGLDKLDWRLYDASSDV